MQDYAELDECRIVVVSAPARAQAKLLDELARAPLSWRGKTVVLWGGASAELAALVSKGAAAASLDSVDVLSPRPFLIEAERNVARSVREVLIGGSVPVIEIEPSTKDLYYSAISFATSLMMPTAAAALECFKRTGLSLHQSALLVERLIQQATRSYVKAGRKGWFGPLAKGDRHALVSQVRALEKADPRLARHFDGLAALAVEMLGASRSKKQESAIVGRGQR